ncbi:restriction endonuclease subunit S [Pseudomonas aeruginosa]|uniref:restriction endonuclease subunit S n=1 Tax=Pseudomonas aeruginosa TaxID=287 RepID=UPI00071BDE0F|nr:restriction endonuclease subunit S [Pseudomonas aeruginosa]KSD38343.1 restriction endonuclease subunit S [Pseudomonas aeruginosa]
MAKLSDLATINPTRKVKKGEFVPFVEMAALPLSGRDISPSAVETRIAKAAGAHFRNGDTLLARITPCLENGKTAQVNVLPDGAIGEGSTEFIVLCGHDSADNDFVYYLCRAPEFRNFAISRMEGTSGRQRVAWQSIANYEFELPQPEVRRAAAEVLATLDDRINNLRQSNATIEAIAAAQFKSRFVNFDGVPPEDMQESELGLIPKGWRVASLDAIADYLNGLALQKFPPESDTEFLPVIKIAQLRAGNTSGADKASTKLKPEYIVQDGDVLFSWSGTLEVEVWTGGRGALNQHLFKVTSCEVPKWFYYFATRQHLSDFRAIAAGKATTMGHIQRGHLTAAKVVVPPPDQMTKHDVVIAPLFEQKINNALRIRTLANLRDALLPCLLAGKLQVVQ